MATNEQALHIKERYLQYSISYPLKSKSNTVNTLNEQVPQVTEDFQQQQVITSSQNPAGYLNLETTQTTGYVRMGFIILSIFVLSTIFIIYGLAKLIG